MRNLFLTTAPLMSLAYEATGQNIDTTPGACTQFTDKILVIIKDADLVINGTMTFSSWSAVRYCGTSYHSVGGSASTESGYMIPDNTSGVLLANSETVNGTQIKTSSADKEGKIIRISLTQDPPYELADDNYFTISGAAIGLAEIDSGVSLIAGSYVGSRPLYAINSNLIYQPSILLNRGNQ